MGSTASAQDYSKLNVAAAVKALDVDASAKPLGATATLVQPAVASTTAVAAANGSVFQAQPAQSVTVQLAPSIASQAAWLYKGGWPLYALVQKFETNATLDQETNCLATAVYFEARGESVEGQLAVARVVMNRAASGRYPPDWCSVVKQPAQFSFVRHGEFPQADTNSEAWMKAEAVAELAASNVVPSISTDVLWYHADYVAPTWRHGLQEVQQIGAHIFYRA
ncbi:MAG TPA: cell wall hydrolase [Sphingomicrobium sp.]|nr:cell wall hydrolase [Sphingomicrobium sp.]